MLSMEKDLDLLKSSEKGLWNKLSDNNWGKKILANLLKVKSKNITYL